MKNIMRFIIPATSLLAIAGWMGCKQDTYSLGPKPQASFTIAPTAGKVNTYTLTNTSTGAFNAQWDLGNGDKASGNVAQGYYPDKGTYNVKLLTLGKGGYDTAVQTITVAADDPNSCFGYKQSLTGCDVGLSKKWRLASSSGGALTVGPSDGGVWWSNSAGDVAGRACQFNDEWTFKKDGTFSFDDHGDFWVDDESGQPWPTDIGLSIGCQSSSAWLTKYKPWSNGNFTFKITGNTLKVMGTGAHVGIYKAGENGTTDHPEDFINYTIVSMTSTKMVLKKAYDWGYWSFTFEAE